MVGPVGVSPRAESVQAVQEFEGRQVVAGGEAILLG
jgi:hypothetical protein